MTAGETLAVEELADALDWPCERETVNVGAERPDASACEFLEDSDGNYDVTCSAVRLDYHKQRFLRYDAAMAYLRALGVRDDT